MSSHLLRKKIESATKSTSGVNNINAGETQHLIIPLPCKDEQKELLEHVGRIIPSIEAAEKEIENQLFCAEILRQSILKKSFSGQLVPQDPNDEPASVLRERIKFKRIESVDSGQKRKSAC